MEHNYYSKYENVELRPLEHKDIELLRIWRNDQFATRFLRQVGTIEPEMQEKWYNSYLNDSDIIIFSIFEINKLKRMVGSVALYNFRDGKCEIGKIQIGDPEAHGMGIGKKALVMAMKIGFECLSLKVIDGIVHQQNTPAHKNDISIGFKIVGQQESQVGGYEDIIEIDYERLKEFSPYVNEVIIGDRNV